jgi:hypothetical protein
MRSIAASSANRLGSRPLGQTGLLRESLIGVSNDATIAFRKDTMSNVQVFAMNQMS